MIEFSPRRTHALLALVALAASGCAAPQFAVIETFQDAPIGWVSLDGRGERPASDLAVEHGRLVLEGARILCQDYLLRGRFRGIVDIGLAGGDAVGTAGVFVQRLDSTGERTGFVDTYSLSINARGEWKAGMGDPLAPFGSRSWAPLRGVSIVDSVRLVVERAGKNLLLRVEGDAEATHVVRVSASGMGDAGFRVGVFTNLARVSVDNFIVGEDTEASRFEPETLVHWGTRSDGENLLARAKERVAEFQRASRRMDFLSIIDTFRAARAAFGQSGDRSGIRRSEESMRRFLEASRDAVARAGADDFMRLVATRWEVESATLSRQRAERRELSERALAAGKPAEALVHACVLSDAGATDADGARVRELRDEVLRPLKLAITTRVDSARASAASDAFEVSARDLERVVRQHYGRLARSPAGELAVALAIRKAARDHERVPATRRVIVEEGRSVMTREQREELERLEKSLPEDVEDARFKAAIVRAGNLTPDLEADLRRVALPAIGVRNLEVHVSDLSRLERANARLLELRRLSERAVKTSKTYMIDATSVTDVVEIRMEYALRLDGKTVLQGEVRAIEGLEQWEHGAEPGKGVVASTYDSTRAGELESRVRRRVEARLRTAIAPERLVAKIDGDAATALLMRIARATGAAGDRDVLSWHLRQRFGLKGLTLDATVRRLVGE